MVSKKKLTLLSVTGLLSVLAVGVAASVGSNKIIGALGEDGTVWKHYAAVEATYTTHGSLEFWASCSDLGTHVFTKPSGTIEEGGNFAETVYFTALEETDDRYVAKKVPSVTFDARGGNAVATQKVAYGTAASELPDTTRAADNYYESYEFGGWYKDGAALADTDTITESMDLKAGWKYGEGKKVYLDNWIADNFTKSDNVTIKTASSVSGFTKTDNDGIMFAPDDNAIGTMTAPATNFNEILDATKAVYMYVGGFNSYNKMNITVSSSVELFDNKGNQDVKYLTRMLLRFTKESDGKVHLHYSDTTVENPVYYNNGYKSYANDVTLTDDQANGVEGLVFTANQKGATRKYWIGKPYYINGEERYLDASQKTGYTIVDADLKKKDEVSGAAPWGEWVEWVGGLNECIGISGNNANAAAMLTFDNINFSDLFATGKGVKFTIGNWNGDQHIYFGDTDLGVNGKKPSSIPSHTVDSIEKTWHNWEIRIDDIGFHAYNKNGDTTYDVPLTAAQLAGTEGISLQLTTNRSNGYFFLLSNLYTYHF